MSDPQSQAETYRSPWSTRYASRRMRANFSEARKFGLWRELWIALAQSERELGLDISAEQIEAMKKAAPSLDLERVAEKERELRHDVMAHLHTFAEGCPEAKAIIHWGATSCFVTDNSELIQIRDGLDILIEQAASAARAMSEFARKTKDIPVLGYTHYQVAQPTTVGKRACLWLQDLIMDIRELKRLRKELPFRGVKGTTGTQASFLQLFEGDSEKVKSLDQKVAQRMGFETSLKITGQTYSRKWDFRVLGTLAGLGVSAEKFGTDMRLLSHERELEEPIGAAQIGSSAMPYKRNPMRSERLCALARYLVGLSQNASSTAAHQWLERTLDDSANRRLSLPESFLAADACLRIWCDVGRGLIVNEAIIAGNLKHEMPFLATESFMMAATAKGGDRQSLHERIRVHSRAAAERLKAGAVENDLLERLKADDAFESIRDEMESLMDPKRFIGRAPQQVDEFLAEDVEPELDGIGLKDPLEEIAV